MIVENEVLLFAQICTNMIDKQISVPSYYKEIEKSDKSVNFAQSKPTFFMYMLIHMPLFIFQISKLRVWKALWIIKTNETCKFNFPHLWMKILKMNQSEVAKEDKVVKSENLQQ